MERPSLTSRFDRWIFESHPLSAESLSLYRLIYCVFLLAVAMPYVVWVSDMPRVLWEPPLGPYALLGGFPPAPVLHSLGLALSCSVVALALGYRPRASALLTGVLLATLIGFDYCAGKISHNRIMLTLIPFALACSGWSTFHTIESGRTPARRAAATWPPSMLALLLGLYFLSSGLPKLFGGWLRPSRHALAYFMSKSGDVGFAAMKSLPPFLLEIGDCVIVAFEIGFVFAVFAGLRWTKIFCAFGVIFHLAPLILLRIDFTEHLIVYGAFVEWSRLPFARPVGRWVDTAFTVLGRAPVASIAGLGIAYYGFHSAIGSPFAAQEALLGEPLALGLVSAGFASYYLLRQLPVFRRRYIGP